jgi:hypothetical protein
MSDTPVTDALNRLTLLHDTEVVLTELHDVVAGKGMYLAEGEYALGELGQDLRDTLFTQLGEAVWDAVEKGYELVITPGKFEDDPDETDGSED